MTRNILYFHALPFITNNCLTKNICCLQRLQYLIGKNQKTFDYCSKMQMLSHWPLRQIHSSPQCFLKNDDYETKSLTVKSFFQDSATRDKETFIAAVETYTETDTYRRGHVEFIYAALKNMEEYGVHRDLEAYKKILDVFPKGKFIPSNIIQAEFWHFPKQQHCGIYLLEQVEYNRLVPDDEMKEMILNIFGRNSYAHRKFMRMMYWLPKFKNINPYPLPHSLPKDSLELAKLALKQMCVDPQTKLTVYQTKEIEQSVDKTWIVSAQSPQQLELIKELPKQKSIYVDGAFVIWLRNTTISYFILRATPKPHQIVERDLDDVSHIPLFMYGEKETNVVKSSVHEQDDGIILGICATGTSSRDSLLSWVRFLHKTNPTLCEIPVLFTLRSPSKELAVVNINDWSDFDDNVELLEDTSNVSEEGTTRR